MKRISLSNNTIFTRFVRASLMIVGIVTIFSLLTIVVLRLSYERILYENSVELMGVTAAVIEREVESFKELSLNIAVEGEVQRTLKELRDGQNRLRRSRLRSDLGTALLHYDPWAWYVSSLRIYDETGMEIITGRDPDSLSKEQKKRLVERSRKGNGGSVLFLPGDINDRLIVSRQILMTDHLELSSIGTVAVFIEFPLLLASYEKLIEGYKMNIHVYEDKRLIGSTMPEIPIEDVLRDSSRARGYRITKIEGSRYFVAFAPSTRTHWTYYSTIPLAFLYRRIFILSLLAGVVYFAMMPGILLFALRFTRRLTVPIQSLSHMMRKVETGNFDIALEVKDFDNASDEVRHLQHDFDIALKKIRELIFADYQKKLQIQEARFKILQTQINPHFLYNTLDSVNWMAKRRGENDISKMVKSLGRLLRRSLGATDRLIALETELSLLNDYLTIQKTRFEKRLSISLGIPEGIHDALVPPFLFQPLAENSIRCVLEEGTGYCTIRITGERFDGKIRLTVSDNGSGFPEEVLDAFHDGTEIPVSGSGIGITNIRNRLQALFPAGRLEISNLSGGALVLMEFPYMTLEEDAHEGSSGG